MLDDIVLRASQQIDRPQGSQVYYLIYPHLSDERLRPLIMVALVFVQQQFCVHILFPHWEDFYIDNPYLLALSLPLFIPVRASAFRAGSHFWLAWIPLVSASLTI